MNLDIEIGASSTVKWKILVREIGIFVMGIEIKASSNVRWRIISGEFLSLCHSININGDKLVTTEALGRNVYTGLALGSAVSIHIMPRSLGSN